MKIISVVGARPNFMKIAPMVRALKKFNGDIEHIICHSGQHYDEKMSKIFFDDLEIPEPKYNLDVGSGTHAEQTAKIMLKSEKVLNKEKPDLVIVVGDVNSTIACSLVAVKLNIKVAHIEAGLRSFDRNMPEEINRILTDAISDYLFVSEESGIENLKREGIPSEKIFFVGNVMIDNLIHLLPKADSSKIMEALGIKESEYILVTLHHPSNVDSPLFLENLIKTLNSFSRRKKVLFPVHPRTRKNILEFDLGKEMFNNIILTDPVGYSDFICLLKNASLVITDSGGVQEESTFLDIPCITVSKNTERPVTVEKGTNIIAGTDLGNVEKEVFNILNGDVKKGEIPDLWDGLASERIAEKILSLFRKIKV